MADYILNNVTQRVNDHMHKTVARMKDMQPTPIGTVKREPREQAAMWRKMRGLPPEQFNTLMDTLAKTIGPEKVMQYISEQVKAHGG